MFGAQFVIIQGLGRFGYKKVHTHAKCIKGSNENLSQSWVSNFFLVSNTQIRVIQSTLKQHLKSFNKQEPTFCSVWHRLRKGNKIIKKSVMGFKNI